MTDAEAAIKLDSNNNLSHFRRATALFYLDNFSEAKTNFEKASELGNKQSAMWIRKCDAELERLKPKSNNNNNTNTTTAPLTKPTATTVSAAVDQAIAKAAQSAPSTPAVQSNIKLSDKVKDSFFQVKPSVTITLFAKNLKEEDVKIDLNPADNKTLTVQLRMPDSSTYSKTWKLFAPVKSNIKTEITAYKVEITLEKQSAEDWLGLEEKEAEKLAGVVKRENVLEEGKKPAYPSSSKKKVEWNEVEKEVKKEIEEEKPEGEQALQKLFQTIYKDASEETRRAMIKSFQTSGGTVLSTNWDEVGKTDYSKERTAPSGQEFRDWNDPTGRKQHRRDDDEELAG